MYYLGASFAQRVTFVVLDEADRMFDYGFEPQISSILRSTRLDRQTCLFSATFPSHIECRSLNCRICCIGVFCPPSTEA